MGISQQIAALDLALYGHIDSQTGDEDRRSLLAIQAAIAERLPTFAYLEIGSHLGGTLQPLIADPRCRRIVSIDPRPAAQPDDRGLVWKYDGNSTERMVSLLEAVPGADLAKLETIERSTEDVATGSLTRPDVCFIDGEHTYAAALRDARFCRAVMHGAGVIVFHDRGIIEPALAAFVRETPKPLVAYPLRDAVFVVELGSERPLVRCSAVASQVARGEVVWRGAARLGASRALVGVVTLARSRIAALR